MSKFCPNSGCQLSDSDVYCGNCGAHLSSSDAFRTVSQNAPAPSAPQPYPQPGFVPMPTSAPVDASIGETHSKKSKKGLIIGLSVGGAVLIAAVLVFIFVFLPMIAGGEQIKAQQTPEDLIACYETEINKLILDGTPLSDELLDTTFERTFIKSEYKSLLNLSLAQLNEQLLGIYDSEFKKDFGADTVEELDVIDYTVIAEDEVGSDAGILSETVFDMPEIEEVRRYEIKGYLVDGDDKHDWTTMHWIFIKTDGKWYLLASGSEMM